MMVSLQRTLFLACMLAICLQLVSFPQGLVKAQSPQQTLPYLTYIPIVTTYHPGAAKPILNEPANGAQLGTLVPNLTFSIGNQPTGSLGCIAYGLTPDPAKCSSVFEIADYGTGLLTYTIRENLSPSTWYYWRIGVILPNEQVVGMWSDQRIFMTGPANGTYPGAPLPITPGNNSTISASGVTMSWSPVSGAKDYLVEVHNTTYDYWCNATSSVTQAVMSSSSSCYDPGSTYEWMVYARNDYAYGPASPIWRFYTPASVSAQSYEPKVDSIQPHVGGEGDWLHFKP